jgi:hypothetical protein
MSWKLDEEEAVVMRRELDIRVAGVRSLVRAQAERMRTRALPRVQESQGRGDMSGQTRQISAKKIRIFDYRSAISLIVLNRLVLHSVCYVQ